MVTTGGVISRKNLAPVVSVSGIGVVDRLKMLKELIGVISIVSRPFGVPITLRKTRIILSPPTKGVSSRALTILVILTSVAVPKPPAF